MRAGLAVLVLLAQTGASFDVVSIKPASRSNAGPFRGTALQNNRWTGIHVTLRELIKVAHELDGFDMPDRVVGGPAWIDKDQFDIVATSASTPERAQLEAMIRTMLVERFHLAAHLEKKTLPAFELTPVRRDGALGSKLRRAASDCAPRCGVRIAFGPPNRMISSGVEMTRFAFVLSTVLQRPVIDRTGLAGLFELNLEFAPGTELTTAVPSDAPSLFTAVEEQLGLKLRSMKAPLDVLVVDRAEKPSFD
jgi:bla regulator protein blaR1